MPPAAAVARFDLQQDGESVVSETNEFHCLVEEALRFQQELRTIKTKVDQTIARVMGIVRPLCLAAVVQYNESVSLKIGEDFEIGFNTGAKKINLAVRLRYPSGHEPDEDFGWRDEVEEIGRKLAEILNPMLAQAGIEYTFGGIQVPTGYYSK